MPAAQSSNGYARQKEIFLAAIDLPAEAQAEFIAHACGGDEELASKVRRLIAQAARPALETSVVDFDGILQLARVEAPPESIGPYKLKEQIGEGGMGIVYVAEQRVPVRRLVALKVIKPGMDSRQVIARFEAERQALALMDHPNIARVFDGGTTVEGRPYFVMELVRGTPITELCDSAQFTIRQRLALFVQVCRAVQHAHQKGIIHRDLKPNNVLITWRDDEAVPKVIDFGVAKAVNQRLTEHSVYTQFSQMIGTPLYMSPEQAQMSDLDIDTRSDVYSLGVLLYELLTGTTPFDNATLQEKGVDEFRRIIREQEPLQPSHRISTLKADIGSTVSQRRSVDPRRLRQLVPGELDWVVMRALEKDRRRRYQSAGDLADDIERYLSDKPVEACPPSIWYRGRKYVRRNRSAILAATLVAAALLAGTAVSLWQAFDANAARMLAETESQRAAESYQKARDTVKKLLAEAASAEVAVLPGMNELRVKLLNHAIASYGELLALNPQDAQVLADRAEVFVALERSLEAVDDLDRAVQLEPSQQKYRESLVAVYDDLYQESLDKYQRGVEHAEIAMAENPEDIAVRLLRASLYRRVGRFEDARTELRAIEKLGPLTAAGCIKMGDIWNNLDEHDAALSYLERAAKLEPLTPNGYSILSMIQRNRGQLRLALAACDKAVEQHPRTSDFRYADFVARRLQVHLELGNYLEALADCNRYLSISPDAPHIYKRRAVVHFHLGQYAEALMDIQTAMNLRPQDLSALTWIGTDKLARCPNERFRRRIIDLTSMALEGGAWELYFDRVAMFLAMDESEQARRDFDKFMQKWKETVVAPDTCDYHSAALLAIVFNRREDYRRIAQFGFARSSNTAEFEDLQRAAWTALLLPDMIHLRDEISALAQRLAKMNSQNTGALLTLGVAHFRIGQFAEAKRYLLQAQDKPEDPRTSSAYIWYFLAMTEHELGNRSAAREWLDQATAYREEVLRRDHVSPGTIAWNRRQTLDLFAAESGALVTPEPNKALNRDDGVVSSRSHSADAGN